MRCFYAAAAILLIATCDSVSGENQLEQSCEVRESHFLLVNGTIGETTLKFWINSSATHNAISRRVAKAVSTTVPISCTFDDQESHAIEPLDFRVGSLRSSSKEPTMVMDLASVSAATGTEVSGILGTPFLRDKTLDFRTDGIYLSQSPAVPLVDASGIACVQDCFGRLVFEVTKCSGAVPKGEKALIDTGSYRHIYLAQQKFSSLRDAGLIKMVDSEEGFWFEHGALNSATQRCGKLVSAETNILNDLKVYESPTTRIGLSLLRDCHARVDFKNKTLSMHSLNREANLDPN